jgi:subtilase family serine protease
MRPNRRKARIHVEQLEARNLMSFTPAQIVHAYGFDKISPPGGRGFGQTIAIIDAYYDPTIKTDLSNFSTKYGLAQLDGPTNPLDGTFTQVDLTGGGNGKIQSPPGDDWTVETALDVEWAHAVAPKANIMLVEASSDLTDPVTGEPTDLLNAVAYANQQKVSTVSMSWGVNESPFETGWDSFFPANNGISYFAASGDSGAGTIWPAVSPNVVAVGGTTLRLNSLNNISSETGWGNGIFSSFFGGSGGGFSQYETPLPSYQSGITTVSNGFKLTDFNVRLNPDVSYDANPNTGFNVIDAAGGGSFVVGGTSAGAPQWAALVALADQSRGTPLSSNQTLAAIYNPSNASGFRDITTGPSTGAYDVYDQFGNFLGTITVQPQVGYDMVTGQGSPKADKLVPLLAAAGTSPLAVRTAAVAAPTSTGSSASGHSSRSGSKDMPINNGMNSAINPFSNQQISISLAANNPASPGVSFVQARPATIAVTQPAPAIQATSPAAAIGSTASLAAISSGDGGTAGVLDNAEPVVMPASVEDGKEASVGPAAPVDDSSVVLPMSRRAVDGFFAAPTLAAEEMSYTADASRAMTNDDTVTMGEWNLGVVGLVAFVGGNWAVRTAREEEKRPAMKR